MASLLQAEQERENRATGRIQNREVVRHFFFFFCGGGGEMSCSKSWRENPKDRIPESEILTTSEGWNLSGKGN